jgi:predicted nucleotidyltransferase
MCKINMIEIMLYEQELTNLFRNIDSVKFAYLFGSTVRGDANELSDVDIAVMLDEQYHIKRHTDKILQRIARNGFA